MRLFVQNALVLQIDNVETLLTRLHVRFRLLGQVGESARDGLQLQQVQVARLQHGRQCCDIDCWRLHGWFELRDALLHFARHHIEARKLLRHLRIVQLLLCRQGGRHDQVGRGLMDTKASECLCCDAA